MLVGVGGIFDVGLAVHMARDEPRGPRDCVVSHGVICTLRLAERDQYPAGNPQVGLSASAAPCPTAVVALRVREIREIGLELDLLLLRQAACVRSPGLRRAKPPARALGASHGVRVAGASPRLGRRGSCSARWRSRASRHPGRRGGGSRPASTCATDIGRDPATNPHGDPNAGTAARPNRPEAHGRRASPDDTSRLKPGAVQLAPSGSRPARNSPIDRFCNPVSVNQERQSLP